jgi:hypothetical protein
VSSGGCICVGKGVGSRMPFRVSCVTGRGVGPETERKVRACASSACGSWSRVSLPASSSVSVCPSRGQTPEVAPGATTAVPDTSRRPHRITTAAANAVSHGAPCLLPKAWGSALSGPAIWRAGESSSGLGAGGRVEPSGTSSAPAPLAGPSRTVGRGAVRPQVAFPTWLERLDEPDQAEYARVRSDRNQEISDHV